MLILNTATALFLEKGYEQTSISDIVSSLDGPNYLHHTKAKEITALTSSFLSH